MPVSTKSLPAKAPPREPPEPKYANMSVENVRRIGEHLYGSFWKNDMSVNARVAKTLITGILNRTKPVPLDFAIRMRGAAIDRIMDIAKILVMPGMPDPQSDRTKKVVNLLTRAHYYPETPPEGAEPVGGEAVPMGNGEFKAVSELLFGHQGTADAAREIGGGRDLGASKSMISRILAGVKYSLPSKPTPEQLKLHKVRTRAVPDYYPERLRDCAIERVKAICDAFIIDGMPDVNSEQTRGIRKLLVEAVHIYEAGDKKAKKAA